MAKAFAKEEKKAIQEALIEAGKKLIGKYGYKKTSIEDVVKEVGISKGAFYRFYLSKEIFFFRVFEAIELEMKEEAIRNVLAVSPDSENVKEDLIEAIFSVVYKISEKGYAKIISREAIESLFKFIPEPLVKMHLEKDNKDIVELVEAAREGGLKLSIKGKDNELISGILRTIFVIVLHPDMIGDKWIEITKLNIGILIDYLMEG